MWRDRARNGSGGGLARGGATTAAGGLAADYARGTVQKWSDLPRNINGVKHLVALGNKEDSEFIDAIWGQSPATVLAQHPTARRAEFDDLEPRTVRVRMQVSDVDQRGRRLVVEWRFLYGRLFMVTVELKRTARDLPAKVRQFMRRKADSRSLEDGQMKVQTWRDGDLLIRATVDGRSNDFALAHRARFEEYARRRADGQKALRTNRRGVKRLLSKPLSPAYRAIEKRFIDAAKVVPSFGHAHVNLCRLYLLWGHNAHARMRCRKARESRNLSVQAEAALFEGMIAAVAGDLPTAKTLFARAQAAEVEDTSVATSSARLLRLLKGKGTRRDFERVYKEVACALVEKDRHRALVYAKSSGFQSVVRFGAAALKAGIDARKLDDRAQRKCGREPTSRGQPQKVETPNRLAPFNLPNQMPNQMPNTIAPSKSR